MASSGLCSRRYFQDDRSLEGIHFDFSPKDGRSQIDLFFAINNILLAFEMGVPLYVDRDIEVAGRPAVFAGFSLA